MKRTLILVASAAALAAWHCPTFAQAPPPPPAHPSLLSRLLHHGKPAMPMHAGVAQPGMMHGSPMAPHMTSMSGAFIGNKKSHVLHAPGDTGQLPAPQNRVYFRSVAAAEAAGYHMAGSGKSMSHHMKMTH